MGTHELIARLNEMGKRVCIPRTVGRKIIAAPAQGEMAYSKFGILEPLSGEDTPCEVALVPLLGVDEGGYRLGYGGGYYDAFFHDHPKMLRVGLAYAGQVVKSVPREAHDVPLHALITEEGVRLFENAIRELDIAGANHYN